jgi:hypothetical protein
MVAQADPHLEVPMDYHDALFLCGERFPPAPTLDDPHAKLIRPPTPPPPVEPRRSSVSWMEIERRQVRAATARRAALRRGGAFLSCLRPFTYPPFCCPSRCARALALGDGGLGFCIYAALMMRRAHHLLATAPQ